MNTENPLEGVERRDFLKIISLAGIGSFIYSKDMMATVLSSNDLSKVILLTNENATDKLKKTVNTNVVKSMIGEGISTFTGNVDIGNSWKSIFPGIAIDNKIAIKVNCTEYSNLGVPFELAKAVIDGLTQMDFNGTKFPENNIIIYEFPYRGAGFSSHGYTVNKSNTGVQCYVADVYSSETYDVAGVKQKLATLITQQVQYLINIAILQDHYDAGISLCLKNHFGTINSPSTCHENATQGVSINNCIAALNALEPIKSKQKFSIINGLFGATNSGAAYGVINCAPNKIIMGSDIVAVDYNGKKLLKELGTPQARLDRSNCIDLAAEKYSLGTNDPSKMDIVNITNTATGIESRRETQSTTELFQNNPNPFNYETNIRFTLQSNEHVQFRIIDYSGITVAKLIDKTLKSGNHSISWNGLSSSGFELPAGIYIGELKTSSYNHSIIIQKVK